MKSPWFYVVALVLAFAASRVPQWLMVSQMQSGQSVQAAVLQVSTAISGITLFALFLIAFLLDRILEQLRSNATLSKLTRED